jgi:hypothetical protein
MCIGMVVRAGQEGGPGVGDGPGEVGHGGGHRGRWRKP